jgi:hypothetical protein
LQLQGLHDPTVSGSSQWRVNNSRLPADPARLMSQTSEKHHEFPASNLAD